MKDAFDNELKFGDDVICLRTKYSGGKARASNDLHKAIVIGFTKKKIKIRYYDDDSDATRFSYQVSKINVINKVFNVMYNKENKKWDVESNG